MIITGIPFDEKLNIGVLSKVFERKRISNCYKYFWFQAILENIVEDKVVFTYDEISDYVWGYDDSIPLNGLKNIVKRLRKKLPEDTILNIFNEGYKINF